MTLSALDPQVALVVIDLQSGVIAMPTVHPADPVVEKAAEMADRFRARGLPVVLVNVTGVPPGRVDSPRPTSGLPPDWTELDPRLGRGPEDILISKRQWGAFTGTALDARLRERGVTQILLCGISTSIGIESTARAAHELGYHVGLVTDAMTDLSADAHENSIERIFPRLGERTTTAEVLAMLDPA